jgi:hypothetical protein
VPGVDLHCDSEHVFADILNHTDALVAKCDIHVPHVLICSADTGVCDADQYFFRQQGATIDLFLLDCAIAGTSEDGVRDRHLCERLVNCSREAQGACLVEVNGEDINMLYLAR